MEMYELWFEYLKRSDDYKEFCEWDKNTPYQRSIPDKFYTADKGFHPIVRTYFTLGNIFEVSFEHWWKNKKEHFDKPYHCLSSVQFEEEGILKKKGIFEENKEEFIRMFKYNWREFKRQVNREPTYDDIDDLFWHINELPTYAFFWLIPQTL